MDMFDLAGALFGNRANPVAQGPSITATGSTASTDGVAGVTFDGDVTPAEDVGEDVDQTVIDLPTSPDVAEGDEVIVTLVGDGPLKTPIVTANPGSGDRMAAAVADARDMASNAETLAEQAEAVANATGQHFWPDDDGIHVTEVTQTEWNDSTSPNYHSGANVLLNSLGQLFRDGLNNLLALLPTGFAYYDGDGNADNNIIVSFLTEAESRFNRVTRIALGSSTYFPSMLLIKGGAGNYLNRAVGILIGDGAGGTSEPMACVNVEMDDAAGRYDELPLAKTFIVADADAIVVNGSPHSMDDVILALTNASATLTRGSGASSWSSGQVRRSGKVVVVTIVNMKLASALASGANSPAVSTIPAGYRPNVLQRVPVALSGAGNYANCWAVVSAGGSIVIHNGSGLSIPTTMEISMNCAYIID